MIVSSSANDRLFLYDLICSFLDWDNPSSIPYPVTLDGLGGAEGGGGIWAALETLLDQQSMQQSFFSLNLKKNKF